mgnify:CR=1 FL=1
MRGEWRQRLIDGAYSIRASGIYQLDKDAFLRDGMDLAAREIRDGQSVSRAFHKQGLTTQQIMGGALDAVTALASAAGASLEDSATIAADAMNVFNIQAKDMAAVVNQITGVANLSKLSVNDYSLALSMGGGVAKQFGVRFEDP